MGHPVHPRRADDDRWLRGASQFQPPSLNCS
jgi:hypothetical protein